MLFVAEFLLEALLWLVFHEPLFDFLLHVLGLLSVVQLLPLIFFIIDNPFLPIIPLHLSLLLRLLPSPSRILILRIDILNTLIPQLRFLELRPGQNLRRDLINFLLLLQQDIAPEDGRP